MAQSAAGGKWVDLISSIIQHANSNAPNASELVSLMQLIEIISEYCPDDILTHVHLLIDFLGARIHGSGAGDAIDIKLRIACAKAVGACMVSIDDDSARDLFKPAILPLMGVIEIALKAGEENEATSIMECLVSVIQSQPLLVKAVLEQLVAAMLAIGNATFLDFSTRTMAVEILLSLTEAAPALVRRSPTLIQGLVPLAMCMCLEVEETDAEWAAQPYVQDHASSDDDCNHAVGESAIERAALGVGGKTVAPLVFSQVTLYASNTSDSRYRRAAVAAICRLAEGSAASFKPYLGNAIDFFASALRDTSPRVIYEAIQGIGQLVVLFPDAVEALIGRFMGDLIQLLQAPDSCRRVRGHVASALINLTSSEHCTVGMMSPYIDGLMHALITCLQLASLDVQPQCLALVG
jgi:hypothetical protein